MAADVGIKGMASAAGSPIQSAISDLESIKSQLVMCECKVKVLFSRSSGLTDGFPWKPLDKYLKVSSRVSDALSKGLKVLFTFGLFN